MPDDPQPQPAERRDDDQDQNQAPPGARRPEDAVGPDPEDGPPGVTLPFRDHVAAPAGTDPYDLPESGAGTRPGSAGAPPLPTKGTPGAGDA